MTLAEKIEILKKVQTDMERAAALLQQQIDTLSTIADSLGTVP